VLQPPDDAERKPNDASLRTPPLGGCSRRPNAADCKPNDASLRTLSCRRAVLGVFVVRQYRLWRMPTRFSGDRGHSLLPFCQSSLPRSRARNLHRQLRRPELPPLPRLLACQPARAEVSKGFAACYSFASIARRRTMASVGVEDAWQCTTIVAERQRDEGFARPRARETEEHSRPCINSNPVAGRAAVSDTT
jgi:hypothetical protein